MNSLAVSVAWKNGEAKFHFLYAERCGLLGEGGGGYLGRFLVGM